jgi:hypothetical protein
MCKHISTMVHLYERIPILLQICGGVIRSGSPNNEFDIPIHLDCMHYTPREMNLMEYLGALGDLLAHNLEIPYDSSILCYCSTLGTVSGCTC